MRHLIVWMSMLLVAPFLPAQQQSVIEGDYIEDRSNHVHGCLCEWSGESVTGGKEATLAWHFRTGQFEGVSLAGVRIIAVIQGENTLSQGAPRRKTVLLLDKAATSKQRESSERLLRQFHGQLIGEIIGRYEMDIEFAKSAKRAMFRVPGLVNVEMREAILPEDALPGALRWYDPFVPLTEYTLGTTLNTRYAGSDFNHKWDTSEPGTRGYFGSFKLDSGPVPAS